MNAREAIKKLTEAGWNLVRVKGSHHIFRHNEQPGTVTVPVHGNRDIAPGTLKSIERQSGLKMK